MSITATDFYFLMLAVSTPEDGQIVWTGKRSRPAYICSLARKTRSSALCRHATLLPKWREGVLQGGPEKISLNIWSTTLSIHIFWLTPKINRHFEKLTACHRPRRRNISKDYNFTGSPSSVELSYVWFPATRRGGALRHNTKNGCLTD